jgi:hypothetical protein
MHGVLLLDQDVGKFIFTFVRLYWLQTLLTTLRGDSNLF